MIHTLQIGTKVQVLKTSNNHGHIVKKNEIGVIDYIPTWRKDVINIKLTNGTIHQVFINDVKAIS